MRPHRTSPATPTDRPPRPAPLLLAVTLLAVSAWTWGPPQTTTTAEPTTTVDTTTTSTVDTTTTVDPTTTTSTTRPQLTEQPEHEKDPLFQLYEMFVEDFDDQGDFDPEANAVLVAELERAELAAADAQDRHLSLLERIDDLEGQLAALGRAVEVLAGDVRTAMDETRQAREEFEQRAVDAYIRGVDTNLAVTFQSDDPGDLVGNVELLDAVLEADRTAMQDYLARRADLDDEVATMVDEIIETERELKVARLAEKEARRDLADARVELAVWGSGSQVMAAGFVFPVFGPNSFADTFGAPRMTGTRWAHWHEGTDITADSGTPLVAAEDGVVIRMNAHGLGGIGLFLRGDSGLEYYYAHLLAYADGVSVGDRVEAGRIVGFVGETGNAVGAHLHFEIADGGGAVNPYPILAVAWEWQADDILAAARQIAAARDGLVLTADGGLRADVLDVTAPSPTAEGG